MTSLFAQPTPPPYQLDGAISYGHLLAIILVIAIIAIVIIGGIVIVITLLGGRK